METFQTLPEVQFVGLRVSKEDIFRFGLTFPVVDCVSLQPTDGYFLIGPDLKPIFENTNTEMVKTMLIVALENYTVLSSTKMALMSERNKSYKIESGLDSEEEYFLAVDQNLH